jgi:chromosome partitioning protein
VKADRALEGEPGSDLRLRRALRGLAEIEATLIDVPSGWGSVACNALCAATHLIIPINCDRFAYDCACDTLARLHQAREAYDLELPDVGVLLTAFDNSINAREIAALCEDTWPDRVFNTRIRHTVKIKELSLDGLTVLGAPPAKTGSAREDYENLFREIERKWL